jgi:hypothetical protein
MTPSPVGGSPPPAAVYWILFCFDIVSAVIAGRRLFVRFATFPFERADVAALLATATFSFLVSNKQGNIWVSMPTFMLLILVIRFERITRDEEHINASSECDAEESDQQQSAHAV